MFHEFIAINREEITRVVFSGGALSLCLWLTADYGSMSRAATGSG